MNEPALNRLKYSIHGQAIDLTCQVGKVMDAIHRALGEFAVKSLLNVRPMPVRGIVRAFDERDVMRYLSPTATRLPSPNELIELYEEGERFWLIDDHWGICEINVLKGQWRSWILPNATADAGRIVEQAVLWPIAQLLRTRGLCMIPAAAVVRDGWGALLLSNFSIEPELTTLVHAGYRIVGQNWVALREEEGRIVMLQMPGSLARTMPRGTGSNQPITQRVDLTLEFSGCRCPQAVCDAVMLVTPGRRPIPHIKPVSPTNAVSALRYAWPLTELHPHRRYGQLGSRIAQRCHVFEVQLTRNPKDVLALIETSLSSRTRATNHTALIPATKVVA